jgi:hypothetical protein
MYGILDLLDTCSMTSYKLDSHSCASRCYIFSHVRPFYEQAVSNLGPKRYIHRPVYDCHRLSLVTLQIVTCDITDCHLWHRRLSLVTSQIVTCDITDCHLWHSMLSLVTSQIATCDNTNWFLWHITEMASMVLQICHLCHHRLPIVTSQIALVTSQMASCDITHCHLWWTDC